ncbi:MAG: response regulator [Patescibacteria group bacterium]
MAGKSKKVLVIEDDELVSRVYGIKLQQEGLEVIMAKDGEEGLQKTMSDKPDLVLLDLMLPNKDGFWYLEEISKKPELKQVPVIVLSNLGQKVDMDKATELGAKDYFVKADSSIGGIVDKIKTYLK